MILVLAGFSGVGKDAVASKLADELGFKFVISHTTRPMREGESQGKPYHFVTYAELMDMKDDMVEFRTYHTNVGGIKETWYYGVHKDAIKSGFDYVAVTALDGVEELKNYYGSQVVAIFIEADEPIRYERAKARDASFCKVEWDRRWADDLKIFTPVEIAKHCDVVVKNNNTIIECFDEIVHCISRDNRCD